VCTVLNPLAIGFSLGGQLLKIIPPTPKLRPGSPPEFSLLSPHAGSKTISVQDVRQRFGE